MRFVGHFWLIAGYWILMIDFLNDLQFVSLAVHAHSCAFTEPQCPSADAQSR